MTQARRVLAGQTLVVASHNQGKVREIRDLLAPFAVTVISAGELNLPEPEETETTFAGNARLKAVAAAKASGHLALSDDSGLAVTALGGDPGIYSARWAGPSKDFAAAMQVVHDKMGQTDDRSGAFICALCLAWPDGHCEIFEGRVEGDIVWPPRGGHGFGYDPFFLPVEERGAGNRTFGEMPAAEKHAISHRARAFSALVAACFA